ncbi:MAG: MFS transporter, partial [Chloroflexi bacterium]|nr:MFS transporter [Chloroflexota bacterium]
ITASAWRLSSWVLPLVLDTVVAAQGWRMAWLALAGGVVLLAVPTPALLTIRRPQDVGLEPEGQPRSGHCHGGPAWALREAVRTRALWLIAVSGFCAWFTMASYNLHLMPYLLDRGFPAEIAVGALAGMGFVSMPATVLMGLLADRIGVRPTYLLAFVLAALGATFIHWLAAPWMIAAYAVCYGVAFGGFVTLQQSIWADYFGRGSLGTIRGVTLPVQLMGNAFGPFLAAVAYDLTGSYDLPFTAFILALLLGAVTMGLARRPRRPLLQPLVVSQEVA